MDKKTVFIVSLLMTFVLIGNVLAITASIGNARMILRAETGDKIEKSILVKNVNDVAVNIALTASGDLKDYITIKDANFTLEPGDEKKAFFTIEVKKSGTTESKINVQFTPVGGKNGAGLSSTIIIIADGTNLDENTDVSDENSGSGDDNSSTTSTSSTKGSITGNIVVGKLDKNMIALGTTLIIALVFIVVLIIYYTKFKKKAEKSENITIKKIKLKKRVKRRG